MHNLDHISASQLSLFKECPRKWAYVQQFGRERASVDMLAGSYFHAWAAEKLLYDGYSTCPLSAEDLAGFSDDEKIEAIERARGFLGTWEKYAYASVRPIMNYDKPLVECQDRFSIPNLDVPIELRVDLVDRDWGVVDWKTTSMYDPAKNWERYNPPQASIQSYVYCLWYLTQIDPYAVTAPFLFCVIPNKGKPFTVNATKSVDEVAWFVRNELAPLVEMMQNGPYPAWGTHCDTCSFNTQCRT